MDSILNPENIKPGVDLKDLERKFISGGLIQQKAKDATDRFNDELNDAAKKLGIDFGGPVKKPAQIPREPQRESRPSRLPNVSIDNYSARASPPESESDTDEDSEPDESDSDDGSYTNPDADSSHDHTERQDWPGSGSSEYSNRFSGEPRIRYGGVGGELAQMTMEQQRRSHIDSIMGSNEGALGFTFEKEKREDIKAAMLSEIDSLMSTLAEEDVDLTRIPRVDRNSSYEEVEVVMKMLRHKNDHTRYCSFAEEFLLFGAYALEDLFDGKRTWFGRYQPDLTGWHNHVNVKLKRMRHDTGQLVNGVMQDYNIGPGARVLLELLPNMVLYSKTKSEQHSQPGLFSDESMSASHLNIRNLTEK